MAFGITAFAESPFAATGSQSINVVPTGISLTLNDGTAQAFTDVLTENVTGIAMSANLGTVSIFAGVEVFPTGQSLTSNLGSITSTADANVSVTGQAMTTNLGTAQGFMSNILITSGTSIRTPGTMTLLDSPSSSSQLTYQPYFKVAGGTLQLNWNNTKSSITAFEIAG